MKKTEEEIRNELAELESMRLVAIDLRKSGDISEDGFQKRKKEIESMIYVLLWVLGEN